MRGFYMLRLFMTPSNQAFRLTNPPPAPHLSGMTREGASMLKVGPAASESSGLVRFIKLLFIYAHVKRETSSL
jgi:hypothetical protein